MQSKNCDEIHEQILNEPSRSQTQLATQALMEWTVHNIIENYNYVINIAVLIENNRKFSDGLKGMRVVDGKL